MFFWRNLLCFQVEKGDWGKLPYVPNVQSPKNYSLIDLYAAMNAVQLHTDGSTFHLIIFFRLSTPLSCLLEHDPVRLLWP